MGQCLSASSPRINSNLGMRATREVITQLGSMNSAVTKEKILLEECKNTASILLDYLSGRDDSSLDAVCLASVTGDVEEMINTLRPIKDAIMSLVTVANVEFSEFEGALRESRQPSLDQAEVTALQTTANILTPDLYTNIQMGAQIRRGTNALLGVLQNKYSAH